MSHVPKKRWRCIMERVECTHYNEVRGLGRLVKWPLRFDGALFIKFENFLPSHLAFDFRPCVDQFSRDSIQHHLPVLCFDMQAARLIAKDLNY